MPLNVGVRDMNDQQQKPLVVRATTICFGVLAFASIIACRSIANQQPEQAVSSMVQLLAANLAFIGVLSGTKFGRKVTICVLGLMAVGATFGFVTAFLNFKSQPFMSVLLFMLSASWIYWFYAYSFGRNARDYYLNRWSATKGQVPNF